MNGNSSYKDTNQFLVRLSEYCAAEPSSPYVHPNIISFPTGTARTNWNIGWSGNEELPQEDWQAEIRAMGILSDLNRATPRANVRICMMVTWTQTWVGKPKDSWKESEWHAWGMATINIRRPGNSRSYGKVMLVWDCDAFPKDENGKEKPLSLMGMQGRAFDELRGKAKNWSVWIGGGVSGEGRCLRETSEWLREAADWDDGPFEGADDARLEGFRFVKGDKSHQE